MQSKSPEVLTTKPHFIILDGLRGIAALAIVIFHFMEVAITDFTKNFIAHGYLAVDFFFCLSGFVVAYAYDDRIEKMGKREFFKSRLIRLHPFIILGSVLGLLSFLFDPFGGPAELYGAGKISLLFLASILLIPLPIMPERFFNLFSFNAPAWSLFWEYIANIVYALILYKIGRRTLIFLVILSAITLCLIGYRAESLVGGWSRDSFWDGGVRVSYSFLMGMLIFRSNWIIKNRLGFIGVGLLLSMAFLVPYTAWNWLVEPMVVLFYFPFIVALGAGAVLRPQLKTLCEFSGNISYPLYMTHYSVIWMFANYYASHKISFSQLSLIVIAGTLLLVGFAYLAMKFYDEPVRRYLKMR